MCIRDRLYADSNYLCSHRFFQLTCPHFFALQLAHTIHAVSYTHLDVYKRQGVIAMRQGNLVPAILSFSTNLFLAPENKYYKNSIAMLQILSLIHI